MSGVRDLDGVSSIRDAMNKSPSSIFVIWWWAGKVSVSVMYLKYLTNAQKAFPGKDIIYIRSNHNDTYTPDEDLNFEDAFPGSGRMNILVFFRGQRIGDPIYTYDFYVETKLSNLISQALMVQAQPYTPTTIAYTCACTDGATFPTATDDGSTGSL
ncbi:hypothetical protein ABW20_dc0107761 [Dactylellina cionopaga]|nr:hypothetical protein ABW20_dc0107761 [Dactylellina cionopaga]